MADRCGDTGFVTCPDMFIRVPLPLNPGDGLYFHDKSVECAPT